MKKTLCELIIFLSLYGLIAVLSHSYVLLHTSGNNNAPIKLIQIERGMNIGEISQFLAEQKIITQPLLFTDFARLLGKDQQIKAGEYNLSASFSPEEILGLLVEGKSVLYKLTIPEGYTTKQIAQLVEKAGLAEKDEFIKAIHDRQLIDKWNIQGDSLEGYLFPDTYNLPKMLQAKDIANLMVRHFFAHISRAWYKRIDEMGFGLHEIITLASLIEKEAGVDSERALVSAVYHNRLKKNIRLQCDPTVIYTIPDFDGNLTREHLKYDSPYNTYRYKGLPPGPIANPGQASIYAALYPEKVDYQYFVSRNDGTHKFSVTLKEHNRAVYKYQKRRKK